MKLITLLTVITTSTSLWAEYRVYQYILKNKIINSTDQPNGHLVKSTLNPVAYLAYNGGSARVEVNLLRTWMCPGHTGHKKTICPSPYDKITERIIK